MFDFVHNPEKKIYYIAQSANQFFILLICIHNSIQTVDESVDNF